MFDVNVGHAALDAFDFIRANPALFAGWSDEAIATFVSGFMQAEVNRLLVNHRDEANDVS